MFQTRKEHMSVERNPTAFGDLRGWIAALAAQGELQEIDAEVDWNIELGTIMRLAQGPGDRQGAAVQQHQGLQQAGEPLPPHLRLRAQQLPAHRDDAGPAARHASARAGQDRPHRPHRQHSAEDRGHRAREGEHHHGSRCRSLRISLAALEPARRRTLSPDLWRLRHQGSRNRDHECRHLSRHGRRPRSDSDPDVACAAYRPPFHRLAERRPGRDADRSRDRLGAVARLHRRLAGAQGHVRVRRDGRHPRRAGRAGEMRDRRPLRAGNGRDRDRRVSRA